MPFVSEAQRRRCYVNMKRDLSIGITPKWDCVKYDKRVDQPKNEYEVFVGPRGGRYIIVDNKKVYFKNNMI